MAALALFMAQKGWPTQNRSTAMPSSEKPVAEAEDRSMGAGGIPTPTPSGSFLGVACGCIVISLLPLVLHDVCIFPLLTKAFLRLISISELLRLEDELLRPGDMGGTPRLANPMTAANIECIPPCSIDIDAEEAGSLPEDGDGMAFFSVVESII